MKAWLKLRINGMPSFHDGLDGSLMMNCVVYPTLVDCSKVFQEVSRVISIENLLTL